MITSATREETEERRLLARHRAVIWRPLWLTREEALRLMELSVASTASLRAEEERALLKLGDLCRAFLRDEEAS